MRTGPDTPWRTILIWPLNKEHDEWYWDISPEEWEFTGPLEIRLRWPADNVYPHRTLASYQVDFSIKEAVDRYKKELRQRFDELVAIQWVEHRRGEWHFTDEFREKGNDVLADIAVGATPDTIKKSPYGITNLGYAGLDSTLLPYELRGSPIYVQLECLDHTKSEVRRFLVDP